MYIHIFGACQAILQNLSGITNTGYSRDTDILNSDVAIRVSINGLISTIKFCCLASTKTPSNPVILSPKRLASALAETAKAGVRGKYYITAVYGNTTAHNIAKSIWQNRQRCVGIRVSVVG